LVNSRNFGFAGSANNLAATLRSTDVWIDGDSLMGPLAFNDTVEGRKAAGIVQRGELSARRSHPGIALNKHFGGDGKVIFEYACALGCEGVVSKRQIAPQEVW
jgi:hypothetical protein